MDRYRVALEGTLRGEQRAKKPWYYQTLGQALEELEEARQTIRDQRIVIEERTKQASHWFTEAARSNPELEWEPGTALPCGYGWFHEAAAGQELVRCNRPVGHEGKHERQS